MKIILVSIGTRGDMEPFLAIGELLADFGLIMTVRISLSWLNRSRRWSFSQISRAVRNARTIYTISPLLFPRPAYWDGNIKILGYQAIKPDDKWTPGDALGRFFSAHKRILFVTFGSMTNPDPEEKTRIIADILERNRIPAVINRRPEV